MASISNYDKFGDKTKIEHPPIPNGGFYCECLAIVGSLTTQVEILIIFPNKQVREIIFCL